MRRVRWVVYTASIFTHYIYRLPYHKVVYYLSILDLWQECEFQSPKEQDSSSKHSTPGRRGQFKSRPVSRNVKTTNKVLKRSKSANTSIQNGMQLNKQTSLTEVAPTKEIEAVNSRVIKSAMDKQKTVIDTQRTKLKEQQREIDELRKLKDQLDSGRAVTNKVNI